MFYLIINIYLNLLIYNKDDLSKVSEDFTKTYSDFPWKNSKRVNIHNENL